MVNKGKEFRKNFNCWGTSFHYLKFRRSKWFYDFSILIPFFFFVALTVFGFFLFLLLHLLISLIEGELNFIAKLSIENVIPLLFRDSFSKIFYFNQKLLKLFLLSFLLCILQYYIIEQLIRTSLLLIVNYI